MYHDNNDNYHCRFIADTFTSISANICTAQSSLHKSYIITVKNILFLFVISRLKSFYQYSNKIICKNKSVKRREEERKKRRVDKREGKEREEQK